MFRTVFALFFVCIWVISAAGSPILQQSHSDTEVSTRNSVTNNKSTNAVVFGYTYDTVVDVNSLSLDSLTHLVLAFFQVDSSGIVSTTSNSVQNLVNAAHKKNVKVLASIGGDGNGSKSLAAALSTSTTRSKLASSLVDLVKRYGMDGVDYDLEFPENMQQLDDLYAGLKTTCAALDSGIGKQKRTLTMTLYSAKGQFGPNLANADAKRFSDLVDYGLLMSYDYFGAYSATSAPNSPFNDVPGYAGLSFTSSISAWLRSGWDPKKLVAGLPYYGRSAVVRSATNTKSQFMDTTKSMPLQGPVSNITGAWTWSDLRDAKSGALSSPTVPQKGWQRFWDTTTQTPWLLHATSCTYIGYDDPESLTIKTNYIIKRGLAGAMVWMVHYDYNGELNSVLRQYAEACRRV
ncbi:hypothetical protein H4S08_004595 [Coemansia sp. RSA 1365]|nr:hypothetical protein H4S08_004595 [Coemansia sp. RSA 1365]